MLYYHRGTIAPCQYDLFETKRLLLSIIARTAFALLIILLIQFSLESHLDYFRGHIILRLQLFYSLFCDSRTTSDHLLDQMETNHPSSPSHLEQERDLQRTRELRQQGRLEEYYETLINVQSRIFTTQNTTISQRQDTVLERDTTIAKITAELKVVKNSYRNKQVQCSGLKQNDVQIRSRYQDKRCCGSTPQVREQKTTGGAR